ncbi:MAG: hypothetical protein AB7O73_08990 [Bacteroidia bacterium]
MRLYPIYNFSEYNSVSNRMNRGQQFKQLYTYIGVNGEYSFSLSNDLNIGWLILPDKSNITIDTQSILDNPEVNLLNKFENGLITQWLYNILSRSEFRMYL